MHPDQKFKLSERFERIDLASTQAHSLVTLLIAWYSVPEEARGSQLSEYHLLAVLESIQKTLNQLVDEVCKAA